jgi:hypothetical protein
MSANGRYNTLATNAQTLNVNLSQHVLYRSKAEILHVLEALISLDTAAAEIKVQAYPLFVLYF